MRLPVLLLGTILLGTMSPPSQALRCGTQLVDEGDFTFQVKQKCGEPDSAQIIGYTLRSARFPAGKREREYAIEQWVYGPSNGYYDVLTFEGGRLRKIERVRD